MELKRETSRQKINRKGKNAWIRFQGFCRRSEAVAKKRVASEKIKARKRQFGLNYLDLMESGGTTDELSGCLSEAQKDLDDMRGIVRQLEEKVESINKATDEKLVRKPSLLARDPTNIKPSSYEVCTGVEEQAVTTDPLVAKTQQGSSTDQDEEPKPSPSAPEEEELVNTV